MTNDQMTTQQNPATVFNPNGQSRVVLVCEHASCFIPQAFDKLGLDDAALQSHIAWDPGALAVARRLAEHLDAKLVASNVSRLVYDCNRPPSAHDAMPARSEAIDVPGNAALTQMQRQNRTAQYYDPFRTCLRDVIAATRDPVIVTIHSFTPVYLGKSRAVEIGILHDTDARLANVMAQTAGSHTPANVAINVPYGPQDGVTHTLKEHAIPGRHLNVMLEIRNDLINGSAGQKDMADCLANWLRDALAELNISVGAQCSG